MSQKTGRPGGLYAPLPGCQHFTSTGTFPDAFSLYIPDAFI